MPAPPPPTTPKHKAIKVATIADLNGLALSRPDGSGVLKVYDQLLPDEENISYPNLIVTTEGEREGIEPASTERWDYVYPVRVFIAERAAGKRHDLEPWFMTWRQQIFDHFRDQPFLTQAVRCWKCDLIPEVLFDPKLPQYQMIVSGFLLRFWSRQPSPGGS